MFSCGIATIGLNVALVFGVALAVSEANAGENQQATEDLRKAERLAEEDRGHRGSKGTLR